MERPLFSDLLSERRRELGFSIGQAARVLRLKEDVIVAFEEGDLSRMPKGGYALGMLSSYARYLGLDANEIINVYQEDMAAYQEQSTGHRRTHHSDQRRSHSRSSSQRGARRARDGGSGRERPRYDQPYETSFDTTRVRYRSQQRSDELGNGVFPQPDVQYGRTRPYTSRTPSSMGRGYGRASSRLGSDIQYRDPEAYGYVDDINIGRAEQSYRSASTRSGRKPSGNREDIRRTRTRRAQDANRVRSRSGRTQSRERSVRSRKGADGALATLLGRIPFSFVIVVVVILALTGVLVFSITSCIRQDSEKIKSVPVSALSDSSEDVGQQAVTDNQDDQTRQQEYTERTTEAANANSGAAKDGETSVSVSVLDGAVTWLEVECDGKVDVAETITGPWQRTYTVEDVLTIQVADTTAVSVVQNGSQVQFESVTSGVGTIRIQGTKPIKKKTSSSDASSSANSTSAEADEGEPDGDGSAPEDISHRQGDDDTGEDVVDVSS